MAIDWLKIRMEYINGTMSIRELAEKHELSYSTTRKIASSEKWSDARAKQREKIRAKAEQTAQKKAADSLAKPMLEQSLAKARIAAKVVKMVEDWVNRNADHAEDTGDIRRIVQSCLDIGVFDNAQNAPGAEREPDALTKALQEEAERMEDADQS